MTKQEFHDLLADLLADVPGDLAVMRLGELCYAFVECGGPPAADLLRAAVQLNRRKRAARAPAGAGMRPLWEDM